MGYNQVLHADDGLAPGRVHGHTYLYADGYSCVYCIKNIRIESYHLEAASAKATLKRSAEQQASTLTLSSGIPAMRHKRLLALRVVATISQTYAEVYGSP